MIKDKQYTIVVSMVNHEYVVKEVNGVKLLGECLKCGKCCKQNKPMCPHYFEETRDGVPVFRCGIPQGHKPVVCAVWPLVDSEDIPEGCGYKPDSGEK